MREIIKFVNSILVNFRAAFSRETTYEWFIVVVMGMLVRSEGIGVTSIIRELNIDPVHYESILHFFRSSAIKSQTILNTWVTVVKTITEPLKVNGYNIMIGDGVKESKEGKKMPAVKKLHQESENSGKAKYIFGHMFGVVSVLIGNAKKQFALPLSASIQDGADIIRKYEEPDMEIQSHIQQVISQAGNIAKRLGKSIILLDRYFLSAPALSKTLEFLDEAGNELLHLVVKAKISFTAYTEPPAYSGKGRPRLKGEKIKLKDLFLLKAESFTTAELYLYGKVQTVQYYCIDLLWGTKLYKKLRFVLVKTQTSPPSIFASTCLTLSPEQIIELYSYRYKIELSFKTLKHTVFGFAYHFWSAYMPKLNPYHKEYNTYALETITDAHAQNKIVNALKAIENFVMCSCIACGILQLISIKFSESANFYKFRWLRTITNPVVSEDTVAYFFRKNFFRCIHFFDNFDIMRIIIDKQNLLSDVSDCSA